MVAVEAAGFFGQSIDGAVKDESIFHDESCEAAVAHMEQTDPDLDPVWGLLVDAVAPLGDPDDNRGWVNKFKSPMPGPAEPEMVRCTEEVMPTLPVCSEEEQTRPRKAAPATAAKPISNVVDKEEVRSDRFPLPQDLCPVSVTRRDLQGCDAFVLEGVLTHGECRALMEQAEGLWSFWDDSSSPRVSFRNAHTIEVTHEELAERIWGRVQGLVNPSLHFSEEDERFEVDIEGSWHPYAMNPKKLLSRYLDGGHFAPHTDGTTVVDFNRRTFYSCVLFLNASPWGGETRIYSDEQMSRELSCDSAGRLTGEPGLVLASVPPYPGRMVVFYHRLMHEGVAAAEKYIIRTDVLYRREPERCTAQEDVEAFGMYQEAQLLAERGDCAAAADLFRRAFKRSPALRQVYRS